MRSVRQLVHGQKAPSNGRRPQSKDVRYRRHMPTDVDAIPAAQATDVRAEHDTQNLQRRRSVALGRVVLLVAATSFFAGTVGWALHARSDEAAINEVDIGFSQDMIIHHDQAVQMALEIVGDQSVDPAIRTAAQEIVIFQRYEIGLLNDSLARWDEPVETKEAMGWMGTPMAPSDMPGLATTAQMERLSAASGEDKAAIFLALMTRHHQGGAAMAGAAAANGRDTITRGVARATNRNQLAEIVEYEQLRKRLGLAIPKGLEPLPNAALTGHATTSMDD